MARAADDGNPTETGRRLNREGLIFADVDRAYGLKDGMAAGQPGSRT